MIGHLGLFSLILIAASSLMVSTVGGHQVLGKAKINIGLIQGLTLSSALLAIVAVVVLGSAFAIDDFSLAYVSEHSNTQLPIFFKVAAIWAGHEGSLLFWVLTLSCWAGLIAIQKHFSHEYLAKVLWVMNLLIATFTVFTLAASNPFQLNDVLPLEGRDLNPMLQDVGLIFHPPLLYLGYVGFSAVLAFAIAALMMKDIEFKWVRYCKNWCLTAWVFLTAGIVLGSWWAYYELGWGGWWFWDPVENASLLPWLTSTALLHCLSVADKSRQLLKWTLSLAIVTFCLSILGTFIVRSGVLTSVHAFTVDPSKGLALLAILMVVLLSAFSLLIIRSETFSSQPLTRFWSKGFLALVATSLFALATLIVLLGTFYPMIFELLGLGAISVGAPYFNLLFAPLTLLTLIVVGAVPFVLSSKKVKPVKIVMVWIALCSIVMGYLLYNAQVDRIETPVLMTWMLALWVVLSHGYVVFQAYGTEHVRKMVSMSLAHVGIAIVAIGAAMNSFHSLEINKKLEPGEQIQFMSWVIKHQDTELYVGPNFTAEQAHLIIEDQRAEYALTPERRHYQVRVMNMSEPAMKWFWHGDIYITMGEKVDANAYAFRIQYKAYVRWVWFGALIAILGAGVAIFKPSMQRFRSWNYATEN
ncbi:heme lyase CcmF/NrfE family subunit [Vibrio sp. T187]|uniref:heme lyase CcmF/NrfE family subunit n=1 Tax=Vibrio TaxID=662 RepID=UPI0010C96ABA|nr:MULTISPECIES: heme lyase CcmF/NrfE family subunit [Vibrio]MBW3694800.1 heme lyase CcmF/NrfE family subunit [Vibrio sp. T187]